MTQTPEQAAHKTGVTAARRRFGQLISLAVLLAILWLVFPRQYDRFLMRVRWHGTERFRQWGVQMLDAHQGVTEPRQIESSQMPGDIAGLLGCAYFVPGNMPYGPREPHILSVHGEKPYEFGKYGVRWESDSYGLVIGRSDLHYYVDDLYCERLDAGVFAYTTSRAGSVGVRPLVPPGSRLNDSEP